MEYVRVGYWVWSIGLYIYLAGLLYYCLRKRP